MAEEVDAWAESTVAGEFHVQLGKRLDAAVNRGDLRLCINNRAVRWGHVLVSESVLAPLTKADIRDLRLVRGDVLVCEGGEIGRASVWNDELPEAYFLNTLHRLRSKGRYDPRLLVAFFERWAATGEFSALVGKSSIAHLTKENLLRVRIPLPKPAEQDRMVETLFAVDQLISGLEHLIAKKQAIKQGMMQQLLTGRTRLPGFSEPWSATTLGTVGTFLKGRGVKRDDVRTIGIPCIRYGELYTAFGDYTSESRSFVTPEVAATALPLQSGDLLFTGSGETRDEIGKCIAYMGKIPAVAGGDLIVLRGTGFNSVYLALLANTPAVVNQKARAGQGDAVVHISGHALAAVQVDLPLQDEQDAIASVVLDADRELASLHQRLDKARDLKTGMMQQLLTGRIRLPVQEAAA